MDETLPESTRGAIAAGPQGPETLLLAAPLAELLTSGGDTRIDVEPAHGLNGYGCSPRPRPEAAGFASSTASSISGPAYAAVEGLRRELLDAALAGNLASAYGRALEAVRAGVAGYCGADRLAGAEVVLAASGTDTELFAVYAALSRGGGRLVNIVLSPDEIGSGVPRAATGRHYGARAPSGAGVTPGELLAGFDGVEIALEIVEARDAAGVLRSRAAIGAEIERRVTAAVRSGAHCLVHLLEGSKTGWSAPEPGSLSRLRARHPEAVDVVVDACQMRIAPDALGAHLERGFMVQVTGSKFLGGPPFSGALVVPAGIAARLDTAAPPPAGLADYTARGEWPGRWPAIRAGLPERYNPGLVARWAAALCEIRAFDEVAAEERARILAAFAEAVTAAIDACDATAPVATVLARRAADPGAGSWDRVPTIFPFVVERETAGGGRAALDVAGARKVHRWLNIDLTDRLPRNASRNERRIAARACHLGQPVRLAGADGAERGALRLCASARLVGAVAFDEALGPTSAERLARVCDDARLALAKVALIARHFDALDAEAAIS